MRSFILIFFFSLLIGPIWAGSLHLEPLQKDSVNKWYYESSQGNSRSTLNLALELTGSQYTPKQKDSLWRILESFTDSIRGELDTIDNLQHQGSHFYQRYFRRFQHRNHKMNTEGYRAAQSRIDKLLDSSLYNCSSSAILYATLGKSLGWDFRIAFMPTHVFVSWYLPNGDTVEVETTSPDGYDWVHDDKFFRESSVRWSRERGLQTFSQKDYKNRQIISLTSLIMRLTIQYHYNDMDDESFEKYHLASKCALKDSLCFRDWAYLTGKKLNDWLDPLQVEKLQRGLKEVAFYQHLYPSFYDTLSQGRLKYLALYYPIYLQYLDLQTDAKNENIQQFFIAWEKLASDPKLPKDIRFNVQSLGMNTISLLRKKKRIDLAKIYQNKLNKHCKLPDCREYSTWVWEANIKVAADQKKYVEVWKNIDQWKSITRNAEQKKAIQEIARWAIYAEFNDLYAKNRWTKIIRLLKRCKVYLGEACPDLDKQRIIGVHQANFERYWGNKNWQRAMETAQFLYQWSKSKNKIHWAEAYISAQINTVITLYNDGNKKRAQKLLKCDAKGVNKTLMDKCLSMQKKMF